MIGGLGLSGLWLGAAHTVTTDDGVSFDSGPIPTGLSFTLALPAAGCRRQ
jgi:hypothetical protein